MAKKPSAGYSQRSPRPRAPPPPAPGRGNNEEVNRFRLAADLTSHVM